MTRVGSLSILVIALIVAGIVSIAGLGAAGLVTEAGPAPDSLDGLQTQPANDSVRLTDNDVADRPPSVAVGEDGPITVWAGHDPEKSETEGFELYTASRSDDGWSQRSQLTDDQLLDIRPSVASTDGSEFVAWSTERDSGGFDLTAARLSEDGLGERLELSDGEGLHLNARVAGTGDRWLVGWFVDQDGDLSTTEDHAVRYALIDGLTLDTLASGQIDGASYVDTTAADGELLMAVGTTGENGQVERFRVTGDGTESVETLDAAGVADVAVTGTATAWISLADGESITVVRDGSRTTLETDARSIRDLSFAPGAPRPTLTYQARFAGTDGAVPAYHVTATDGWSGPRQLSLPAGFATTDLAAAATDDELVALASAVEDPAGTADLFALSRPFQPDLRVQATADTDSAAVGAETTIEYTVTNSGDTASPPTVVVLRDRTGGIDSATVPELAVGESTTASFSATVGRAGEFEVAVDPGGAIAEFNRSNNDDVVVLAQPDLAVTGVSEQRDGDQLTVEVSVRNNGSVPAGPFSVSIETDTQTDTGSLPGLGAGRTIGVPVEMNASDLGRSASVTVTADPEGSVDEPDTTDNVRPVRLLQPDLAVAEPVEVSETDDGATVQFGIRNGNTGSATATATVATPEEVVETTVEVPAARNENDTVVVPAAVNLSTVPDNESFAIRVEPETVDATPTDNVFGQVPGGFPEPQPDLSLSVESPGEGTTVDAGESVAVTVRLENAGDGRARETLTVEAGSTTEQRFEVPPGDEIELTVEVDAPETAGEATLSVSAGDRSEQLSLSVDEGATTDNGSQNTTNSASTATNSGDVFGPGFGVTAALIAVLLGGLLAHRRRDRR